MCGWYLKWSVLTNTFAQFAIISVTVSWQCCLRQTNTLNSNWMLYLLNFCVASPHAKVLCCNPCHLAVGIRTDSACLCLTYYFSSFFCAKAMYMKFQGNHQLTAETCSSVLFTAYCLSYFFIGVFPSLQNFKTFRCKCVCKFRFECVILSYFCNYCFNESFKLFIDVMPKRKQKQHACMPLVLSLKSDTLDFICFAVR